VTGAETAWLKPGAQAPRRLPALHEGRTRRRIQDLGDGNRACLQPSRAKISASMRRRSDLGGPRPPILRFRIVGIIANRALGRQVEKAALDCSGKSVRQEVFPPRIARHSPLRECLSSAQPVHIGEIDLMGLTVERRTAIDLLRAHARHNDG
jgi:hypothetical protein